MLRPLLTLLMALAAVLAAGGAVLAQPRFDFDRTPGRLSKDVRPEHHAITLDLDPAADAFDGRARIRLALRQAVPAIEIHAHQLEPGSARLGEGGAARELRIERDEAAQIWRLVPADGGPVPAGGQLLELAWRGRVQSSGAGLFAAPHRAFGQPARMLATQLEAVYARMVFPAFDEPAFRSVFEITVRTPRGWEVLSNMLPGEPQPDGDRVLHRFAPTPPMPSYLVAVAVGRFDALSGSAAGVPLRILTAPGKRDQGAYALEATKQLLPYYTGYFGLPYALPKLDQLAVPATRFGAMEDWGLISYAEGTLLYDPATSDTETQRRVYSIVAHEVAHQWFGNLVTAASWEEIWLNEAFATWMAEKATDRFNPEWQVALRRREPIDHTMARDASSATRAIRSGTVRESQVFDVFDNITYVKGGAVLSMIEQWLGAETFRKGLAAYMAARRMSNATAGDLWHHIGEAGGRDVAAVAASWTDQPGFPLVQVKTRCEEGRTVVELAQGRLTDDSRPAPGRWQIPLVLRHGGATHTLLFGDAAQTHLLPGCPAEPLLVNPGGEGYYRVAYPPAHQAALAARFAELPPGAQVTLLSDAYALAGAGRGSPEAWMELLFAVPSARGATREAVIEQARVQVGQLRAALAGTPAQAVLERAARRLLGPELQALGWEPKAGESSERQSLRGALIDDLARWGDTDVAARARAAFDADESGRVPLPAALRGGVIRAVGAHAGERQVAQLVARAKAAQREEEQWLIAEALAGVADPAQARRVLDLVLDGSFPSQVALVLPAMMAERGPHGDMVYRHVLDHWADYFKLAGNPWTQSRLLPNAAGGFNERAQAERLRADQQRLLGDAGAMMAARTAARIELAARVKERDAEALARRLRAFADGGR